MQSIIAAYTWPHGSNESHNVVKLRNYQAKCIEHILKRTVQVKS